MNDNISINEILKNAAERAKKRANGNSEPKKGYSNWGNHPKDESKPFDMGKTTEALSQRLNDFSSTVSVKFAQSVSQLNDRVNKKEKTVDLGSEYPNLLDEWEEPTEEELRSRSRYSFDKDSFLSSSTVEDIAERLRKASQKARDSETFVRFSDTLNEYKRSASEAFDLSADHVAETIADTAGSVLFEDMKNSRTPVIVSGKEKGRVVQELSDTARNHKTAVEQIPMVLKDELSLRRLVADVRENENKNRVVVLDIADSPNAEQLKMFEKFTEDAKLGNFYLVILSDDEFSNSWFGINGAIQRVYDY